MVKFLQRWKWEKETIIITQISLNPSNRETSLGKSELNRVTRMDYISLLCVRLKTNRKLRTDTYVFITLDFSL